MAITPIQNSGETKVSDPFRQLFWTAVNPINVLHFDSSIATNATTRRSPKYIFTNNFHCRGNSATSGN